MTPNYYDPYYGDLQKGTPNFGKPPFICSFAGAYSKDYIVFRVCLARGKNRNERKGLGFSVKDQVYWDFLGGPWKQ